MHFHSCTITPVDNIPDLLRESGTFLLHPRELQRADNMKPKSLPLRLSDRNPPAAETLNAGTAKYQRHVDCADHQESVHHSGHADSRTAVDSSRQKNEKSHREIHFAFLPERYEPLMDEAQAKAKEEKKKRKKEQYKKVRKNVGKALRATWKCLMLGLYNFALGYSTPITVAATFVPDFHPSRNTS